MSVNETTPLSSLWPHLTSLKIAGLQWLPRRDPQQFLRGLPRSLLELNLAFPDAPFSIFDLPLLPKSLTNLTLCMIVPNDPDTQPSAEMHACLDQLPPQLTQLGLLCPFFPSFIEHLPTTLTELQFIETSARLHDDIAKPRPETFLRFPDLCHLKTYCQPWTTEEIQCLPRRLTSLTCCTSVKTPLDQLLSALPPSITQFSSNFTTKLKLNNIDVLPRKLAHWCWAFDIGSLTNLPPSLTQLNLSLADLPTCIPMLPKTTTELTLYFPEGGTLQPLLDLPRLKKLKFSKLILLPTEPFELPPYFDGIGRLGHE